MKFASFLAVLCGLAAACSTSYVVVPLGKPPISGKAFLLNAEKARRAGTVDCKYGDGEGNDPNLICFYANGEELNFIVAEDDSVRCKAVEGEQGACHLAWAELIKR
jgi:hypothetical protein